MARILLIDDDDAIRCVVHRVLDRHGHTVIEARDGEEGLELLPHVLPDLLITDLMMPRKSGLEVLAEVREKYPPMKAIAISGGGLHGAEDCMVRAKALGAAKVLAKPFSCATLLEAVDELLAGRAAGAGEVAR